MKINFVPKIDYTKENFSLISTAGVLHAAKNPTRNNVKIALQWRAYGMNIEDRGQYLATRFYSTEKGTCRVGDFKKADIAGTNIFHNVVRYWSRLDQNIECFEIRLYRNGKSVIVAQDNLGTFYALKNLGEIVKPGITPITTEEEAEAASFKVTKKAMQELRSEIHYNNFADLARGSIDYMNAYTQGILSSQTQEIVKNFFGFEDPANARVKSVFGKNSFHVFEDILDYARIIVGGNRQNSMVTKANEVEKVFEAFKDNFNNQGVKVLRTPYNGEEVIAFCCNDCGDKAIFLYETKSRKRKLLLLDGYKSAVPSANLVLGTIARAVRRAKNNDLVGVEYIGSPKDLYRGTNVEYIYNEIPADFEDVFLTESSYYVSFDNQHLHKVKQELLNSDTIVMQAAVLLSSNNSILEQLLKTKLFNLYFYGFYNFVKGNMGETFADPVNRKNDAYNRYAQFEVNTKGKNLKEMFGTTINVLRHFDSLCVIEKQVARYSSTGYRYMRSMPQTRGVTDLVGPLEFLDAKTIEALKNLLRKDADQYGAHYWFSTRHCEYWAEIAQVIEQNTGMGPKQRIAYLEAYAEDLDSLRDYLRIRGSMKNLSETREEYEDVFSDSLYPIKPGKAKRFIPFMAGMRNLACHSRYSSNRVVNTQEQFKTVQEENYKKAFEEGRATFATDLTGRTIMGVSVSMTPYENMKFLHDQLSYWSAFYQDETKDADFKKAVQRVVPFEYESKKFGLKIVAPVNTADLRREGDILSHCVASYMDPIIDGTENIMFIRRTDMPDAPFFTLEVMPNGDIRQVHCFENGALDDAAQAAAFAKSQMPVYNKVFDIVGFLNEWANKTKGINAKSIRAQYSALCAVR